MGVILQVALPSRVLAAAMLQCGAAGAGASRGLGVCAEHARLAARGESARAMEIGDFLVGLPSTTFWWAVVNFLGELPQAGFPESGLRGKYLNSLSAAYLNAHFQPSLPSRYDVRLNR